TTHNREVGGSNPPTATTEGPAQLCGTFHLTNRSNRDRPTVEKEIGRNTLGWLIRPISQCSCVLADNVVFGTHLKFSEVLDAVFSDRQDVVLTVRASTRHIRRDGQHRLHGNYHARL